MAFTLLYIIVFLSLFQFLGLEEVKRKPDYKIVDRIDIQCEVVGTSFSDLSNLQPGESSAEIRKRVLAARAIQTE